MIKITCVKKPSEEFILLTGKDYTVGRKGCELTFGNDHSVSRNHACIMVDHPIANISNSALTPSVVVTDLGSKFGTFVNDGIENNQQAAMREPNTLSSGDRFRFGLQWNEFKIKYTPLITTSSGTIEDLPSLRNTICQLGGHLLPEWKEGCDYLITESLSLTVKAVCALLSAKYIVTPKYFHDYLEAVKGKAKLPNPADYTPVVKDKLPLPCSFEPNLARTKLFESKIFLFPTPKQSKKLTVALRCAGGVTDIISSISVSLLKSENTMIVCPVSDIPLMDAATRLKVEIYQSCKKRTIPESEIGFAAVYASVERYCNPFINIAQQVFPRSLVSQTQHSATPPSSVVVVPETQLSFAETQRSTISSQLSQGRNIVDETVLSSQSETSSVLYPRPMTAVARLVSLGQSQSQPMEFAVPTPRIKEEVVDESEFRPTTRAGTVRTGDESAGGDGSSGNKRRREGTSMNSENDTQIAGPSTSSSRREPSPKRPRSETRIDDKAARYTADSSKTLSSIFGMSDDDEEDEPEPEPPVRTTRSTRTSSAVASSAAVAEALPPPEPVVDVIPATPEVHDIADDPITRSARSSRSRSESKSPVKQESLAADSVNSKRKQPVDKGEDDVEPSTSKKRRTQKVTPEIKRSTSIDGFTTVPGLHDSAKKVEIKLRSSERLDEHIPEADIKPLSFTFAPLIKRTPRPVIQEPTENGAENGRRSAFNFKAFKKVLPLCLNNSIANRSTRSESNPVRTRSSTKMTFRPFNSLGFVDSEPFVASNRMSAGMGKPETPDKRNTNTNTNRSRVADESMDEDSMSVVSVVDASPTGSTSSTSTLRRSGRNARGAAANSEVQNTATSIGSRSSPSKRGTRSTPRVEDSPPSFFEEENEPDPPGSDDEWAF